MKLFGNLLFATIMCLSILFTASLKAEASWTGLTTQELFEESDVILIGDAKDMLREERVRAYSSSPLMWYTKWKVDVNYYLKGDLDFSQIVVGTPGAKGKREGTSIDYWLDDWESPVILFLRDRGEFYEPLSPQGVESVQREAAYVFDGKNSGYAISQLYKFSNYEIEQYIINNIARSRVPQGNSAIKEYNYGIFTLLVPVGVLLLITPFLRKG